MRGSSARWTASELVAVVDTKPERAAEIAAATGTTALTDYRELLERQVDAVTVAVPTELHRDIALPFLERGIAVLVEKPMARSLTEADAMLAAAAASGATLAVGHTERYNPAVAAVLPLVTSPRFIEVHRLGAFSGAQPRHRRRLRPDDSRPRHHPLAGALGRRAIEAVGVPVLTDEFDIANARLRFATAASPTSRPAASAATASARSGSSSRTPTCRSTTPRRRSKAGAWCGATAQRP